MLKVMSVSLCKNSEEIKSKLNRTFQINLSSSSRKKKTLYGSCVLSSLKKTPTTLGVLFTGHEARTPSMNNNQHHLGSFRVPHQPVMNISVLKRVTEQTPLTLQAFLHSAPPFMKMANAAVNSQLTASPSTSEIGLQMNAVVPVYLL